MSLTSVSFRSLRSNALSVLTARLAVPVLNLVLVISIARQLGVVGLGQYTLLVTGYLLLENLKSLGLPTLLVREVAKDRANAGAYYQSLVQIGLAGALICLLVTAVAGRLVLDPVLLVPAIVVMLGLFPSAYALANDSVCLALGNAHYTAVITTVENLVRLVLSLTGILIMHWGVLSLMTLYATTRLGAAIAGLIVIRRKLNVTGGPTDFRLTLEMLKSAPEFLIIFAFPILLFRLDVVLLAMFAGDYVVGIYAVAIRLISVCLIIPDSIMTASFVVFSRASGVADQQQFHALVQRTIRWMALLLFPITLGGLLLGPAAIRLLFGHRFDLSTEVLKVLVWALVPFAVNRAMGDALVARGHQRTVAKLIAFTLVCSIAFYVVAIRSFGVLGAAWGFVFSVGLLCGLTALEAVLRVRVVDRRGVAAVLVPLIAGVICFIVTRGSTGFIPSAAISTLCLYAFTFAVVRELRQIRRNRSVEAS
jgi:O-antigen/teichoic acid export membrane protein